MSFDFEIVNGDIAIGDNGDLKKIENTAKLIQDILKIAITPLGSNQFASWYGSPISRSLIGQTADIEFLSTVSSAQLQNSFEILQKLQQEQAAFQNVTPFELLAAIKQIKVDRNITDPRYYTVIISVLTRALTEATTRFELSPTL